MIEGSRWAIIELMGHRRVCGQISEELIAGVAMLRIDLPQEGQPHPYTQYYSGTAVFSITLVTVEAARTALAGTEFQQTPPWEWELRELAAKVVRQMNNEESDPLF